MTTGTILPCSPLSLCEDRFSLLPDSNEPLVHVWSLIVAVLTIPATTVHQLIGHMETFAISIHGRTSADFSQLIEFLCQDWNTDDFLIRVYPALIQLALELPVLFPTGVIPTLTPSSPSQSLSRRQIACIVVHQFLCTISPPSWLHPDSSPDFHIWYDSGQPQIRITRAYLCALFTYFDRVASSPWITKLTESEWPISLTLHSYLPRPSPTALFTPLTVRTVSRFSTDPSLLGLPFGACVIFANKYIGFGRTGTQEEMHVGCSPEASPALLFTPALQDDQVLVLEGVEAMVSTEGYGRSATLAKILSPDYEHDTFHTSVWRRRTMLFMDALELDSHDSSYLVADLLPGYIDRELAKAYTAFASYKGATYSEAVSGLWGCGAFGGNPKIKSIVQWCAASLASVPLTFVCEESKQPFVDCLQKFSQAVVQSNRTVESVLSVLRGLHPEEEVAEDAFAYVLAN